MKKARLLALFGSVCLVLALLVTLIGGIPIAGSSRHANLPTTEVEPEISFEDGVPLMPNVVQAIVLSGSDYDMGYQYAQQLNQIFGSWALERLQRDFTREETKALKAYQWYVKEYTPEFIDRFKGMADGATDAGVELSYAEALADDCMTAFDSSVPVYPGTEPPDSQNDRLPPGGRGGSGGGGWGDCSGFAAWGSTTEDGELICAGSGDHDPGYEFIIVVLPETGNNYINRICIPRHTQFPGMNNKGLAYAHHGAGTSGNEARGYGVPKSLIVQHTLRFADDAAEALAMQLAYPSGERADGLWADVGGDAFDLECRDPQVVRRAGDYGEEDFLYASNSVLDESLEPLLMNRFGWPLNYFEHGGWNLDDMNSVRRDLHMWNALHNYQGEVDLDFAKMMMRMPGPAPDYPTLEEAEIELNETHGEGWDTYIGNLGNGLVGIMLPDDGDQGLYYACVRNAGRQAEPLTQGWYFYQAAQTYTFYELQLASNPADIVNAAKQRSQYDLYYANKELRKLTYADVAYAPLDEIFNQAATESQKGDYYLNLARSTQGNESIYNYAKALRAFTRCQVYANQVYESLVPPADDPTDLGLDEWFGSWGEWTTAPDGDDDSGNP